MAGGSATATQAALAATTEVSASRLSPLIAGFWLVLLINPILGHIDLLPDPAVVLAYVVMVPFVGVYLWLLVTMRDLPLEARGTVPAKQAWGGIAALLVMCALTEPGWGQDAINLTAYPVLAGALVLPQRQTAVFVPVVSTVAYLLTVWFPGWENDINVPLVLLGAGFVMASVRSALVANIDLVLMRLEYRNLLLEQERNRFARDLHDLLGHSLTLLTVKAELAGRLLDLGDDDQGREQVADLERLSREALAEVRTAVHGYRETSLPGEISRARSALDAAGIEARTPLAVDQVSPDLRELFAWVVREGVTNVVRHGDASWCEVALGEDRVSIRNDLGPRATAPMEPPGKTPGSGLLGLRSRALALGLVTEVRRDDHVYELVVGRPSRREPAEPPGEGGGR